jgi:carbon monoxide dehydrogenase subunit G
MLQLTTTRDVAAPPARVFAVATDLRNAPGRIRGITKMEVLTEGPVRVGTRFRETRRMFGREATEEMEIVALDPPRSYAIGCESCGCRYRTELRFTPKGAGTELQMQFQAEPLTFMAKVIGTLMKPMARKMLKECAKDLDDIATHAEKH